MWTQVLFRAGAISAGGLLLYGSMFLYEDEQGKVQNRLEGWWVKLDDQGREVTSNYGLFLRRLSRLTSDRLDALFGDRLLTIQAFLVSFLLSLASVAASAPFWPSSEPLIWRVVEALFGFLLIAFAVSVGSATAREVRWALALILLLEASLTVIAVTGGSDPMLRYSIMWAIVMGSILCDWMVIALVRWTLQRISDNRRTLPLIAVLVANLCAASALVLGPLIPERGRFLIDRRWGISAGEVLSRGNLVDALVVGAFLLSVALALLHRLLWPTLSRSLYAIQALGIERRRKLFFGLGIALLVLGGLKVPEALKRLLEM